MPNHVHMLILPLEPVREVMRWLKGSTACGANRILERTGSEFWQRDFFDHYLRSSSQIWKFIDYIEANPVRSELVCSPGDWKWSSAGWKVRRLAGGTARPADGGGSEVGRRRGYW
jgi:REP element-mobilizing transposase RayT